MVGARRVAPGGTGEWYSDGGIPHLIRQTQRLWNAGEWPSNAGIPTLSRQIRVRVGCAAQSDGAPAMSGLAAGAKRIVNMLIAPV